MNRKLKIVLCLAGIFVAGAAAGAFVALRVARHVAAERLPVDAFVPRQMARLTGELDLDPAQKEQVRKILQQAAEEMRALRRESIQATSAKVRELNAKIAEVLTPGQEKKFEEVLKRQRERMRRFQQERMEGRRGPGDGRRDGPRDGEPDGPRDGEPPPGP